MLTTKNPNFESIAEAMHFLTENRNLVDAYIRYNAEEAYKKKLKKFIAELEKTMAELKHAGSYKPWQKIKDFSHRH